MGSEVGWEPNCWGLVHVGRRRNMGIQIKEPNNEVVGKIYGSGSTGRQGEKGDVCW